MKNRARRRGQSLNGYVESLINQDLSREDDRYEALFHELSCTVLPEKVSDEVNDFVERYKLDFSAEELGEDEKPAYLLSR